MRAVHARSARKAHGRSGQGRATQNRERTAPAAMDGEVEITTNYNRPKVPCTKTSATSPLKREGA